MDHILQVNGVESITLEDAIELLQYPVTLVWFCWILTSTIVKVMLPNLNLCMVILIQGNHPEDDHPVLLRLSKSGFSIKHRRTIAPVPKVSSLKLFSSLLGWDISCFMIEVE